MVKSASFFFITQGPKGVTQISSFVKGEGRGGEGRGGEGRGEVGGRNQNALSRRPL